MERGDIAGAAVDVFSEEPAVGNVLTTSDRIVVTPHLAASTSEAQERAAVTVAEQVIAVLDGQPARFAINAPLVDPETMAVVGPYIDAAEIAASIATQLVAGALQRVHIEYLGEISNFELSPLRAAVIVGMFERVSDEKVTIVNADRFAEQYGIRIDEERGPAREPYANLVVVQIVGAEGEMRVAATHTPEGVRVVSIGEFDGVELSPAAARYVLAIENLDRPGMIGAVGQLLGGWDVNIKYMSVAPGRGAACADGAGDDPVADRAGARSGGRDREHLRRAPGRPLLSVAVLRRSGRAVGRRVQRGFVRWLLQVAQSSGLSTSPVGNFG